MNSHCTVVVVVIISQQLLIPSPWRSSHRLKVFVYPQAQLWMDDRNEKAHEEVIVCNTRALILRDQVVRHIFAQRRNWRECD